MPSKFTALTPELHGYLVEHGARQDELLRRLAAETAELGGISIMQISPEQGALMNLLVRAIGARRALELGHLHRLLGDLHRPRAARRRPARHLRRQRGVDGHRAPLLRRGRADASGSIFASARRSTRCARMPADEPFDFAFIDADKVGYLDYYEEALRLLRPGGLAMIDNVLRGGRVVDPDPEDEGDRVVLELNERVIADERVDVAMLGVSDGVTLVLKR